MELLLNIDTRTNDGKTLLEYLQKLTYVKITSINDEDEKLDKGLLNAMVEGKKTKFVSKSKIMKKLQQ